MSSRFHSGLKVLNFLKGGENVEQNPPRKKAGYAETFSLRIAGRWGYVVGVVRINRYSFGA